MLRHYSVNLAWSDADQAYVATSAEFPGLSGVNEDPEAALAELREALELAFETYEEEGWSLPEPRSVAPHSGQVRLRLPKSTHTALAEEAERENVSLNTLAVAFISEGLGKAEVQRSVALELRRICTELAGSVHNLEPHRATAASISAPESNWIFQQGASGPLSSSNTH